MAHMSIFMNMNHHFTLGNTLSTLSDCNNTDTRSVLLGARIVEMFDKQAPDNSWMFDGGIVTQGSVFDIKSARSYVYQFEEYIRWTQASVRDEWRTRQRFVFNVGLSGQSLADSLEQFDLRTAQLDPRAAVYLIGKEDCQAGCSGIDSFQTNLSTYIAKALQLRSNTGFAVIQTPHPFVKHGKLYADAAREVVRALGQDAASRVQLVDHFNWAGWDASDVNSEGNLTDLGHLKLGRQLCKAVFGSDIDYPATTVPANFPQLSYARTPARYIDTPAAVTAEKNSLNVVLPANIFPVTYELQTEAYTLTGTAVERSFTIPDLPSNASYTLTLTAADGQTRLPVMVGTIQDGVAAARRTYTVHPQLKARMAAEKPMMWMFMGDSITHGAFHTCGYASISQLFEQFLRDDLGRVNDLVLNTAVSSAATADTVEYLNERLNKYQPDVVFLMLGANCTGEGLTYQRNLTQIVHAALEKGAIVILRTPVCKGNDISGDGISFSQQAELMRQVAAETGVTLIEQNSIWGRALKQHPYLSGKLYNNDLHPNALGHIWMFRMLLEGIGLAQDNSVLYHLAYDLNTATSNHSYKPFVAAGPDSATLDTAKLAADTALTFSEVTLTATDKATGRRYSVTTAGDTPAVLTNLPANKSYTYQISAQENEVNHIFLFSGTTDPQQAADLLRTSVHESEVGLT